MIAQIVQGVRNRLSRRRNPLLRDPEYAGLHAQEAALRRKHKAVATISQAKTDRLHAMLRGAV